MNHKEFLATLVQELPPTPSQHPFSIEEIKNSFTDASVHWKSNKRRKGAGYIYQCQHQHKNGKLCKRDVHWHHGNMELICKYHFFDYQKKKRSPPVITIDEEYL